MMRKSSTRRQVRQAAQLTVVIRPDNRAGCSNIAAEQPDRLTIGRQFPLLTVVLLAILLIARHLRQHMMNDAGLFL